MPALIETAIVEPIAEAATPRQPANPTASLAAAIRTQIKGKLPKRPIEPGYKLSLTLTAIFVFMLPLVYAGLILGCVYGIYYYVTEIVPSLLSTIPRGRGAIIAIALYTGPVLIGGTIILFMIKPIFNAVVMPESTRKRSLIRKGEPLLFELVDHICEVTGAPTPIRIDVDFDVNASASFGQGLKSLFGNELVLTIGVPLVAGLNTREFAGVLAHEFGHFSQSTTMRASYSIRSINHWFARAVYERDAIDDSFEDMIEDAEARIALVMILADMFIFITHWILWLFMMASHLASSFMLRQMEFDADRYEVYLSGSKAFASTSKSLRTLAFAQQASMIGVEKLLDKAVLIDNIPRMTQSLRDHLTPEQQEKLRKKFETEQTGIFDTHPCDRDRVAAADKIDSEGMFQVERPARELFQYYDALCQGATQDFYRNVIGRMVQPSELQPVEQHIASHK